LATAMHDSFGVLPTNIFILVCMVVAAVPACFMKDDLRRQRAQKVVQAEVSLNSQGDEEETLNEKHVESM
uniref:MFS transporter n=1 Tax=Rodentolepis nana TaxID=102285 RepID=A0A0R3TB80_RODNA